MAAKDLKEKKCKNCEEIKSVDKFYAQKAYNKDKIMTEEYISEQEEIYEARKEEMIIKSLSSLLNDCLESANQEYSFKVRGIENNKFVVEFNIVEIDDEFMFNGY